MADQKAPQKDPEKREDRPKRAEGEEYQPSELEREASIIIIPELEQRAASAAARGDTYELNAVQEEYHDARLDRAQANRDEADRLEQERKREEANA